MIDTLADREMLQYISIDAVARLPSTPTQKIRTDEDLEAWRSTTGYRDYAMFLRQLSASVVGCTLPWSPPSQSQATTSILSLLDELDNWIDEIPPQLTPQRFGNLAFRAWGNRLENEHNRLLTSLLPEHMLPAVPHLAPYLLTSFGSFTRMDYGTGHETSFALFLLCLALIRFFEPNPEVEREIVLIVFLRYLRLCWRLQDVYKLEPAGSHGVWGLDDYSFLGYIFGSAQLQGQTDIPVSAVIHPPLPPTNLYFLSISRILTVKQGPFFEHSSQLYSIATGVQHWSKVNSGLFKMYEAEVLGKRVVVQHIPLGGLLEWNPSNQLAEHTRVPSHNGPPALGVTPAWTASSAVGTIPRPPPRGTSAAPWANSLATSSSQVAQPHTQPHPPHGAPSSRQSAGPLVTGQLPLGPLASSSLRPLASRTTRSGPAASNPMPPPSGHH